MSSQRTARAIGREALALVVAAGLVVIADQITKALVIASLGVGERVSVLGDLIVLWHAQNEGAAFSLLQGGALLFLAVGVVAVALIVAFHRRLLGRPLWLHVVLGVILGGALGNLVDRVRLGYVTDFVSVGIGDLRWPTFNVADSSLSVGITVLVIWMLFVEGRRDEAQV